MKVLRFIVCVALSLSAADAERIESIKIKTVEPVIARIRTVLPPGWTVSYDSQYSCLTVSRDKPALLYSQLPNLPPDYQGETRQYSFMWRITPLMDEKTYKQMSVENAKVNASASEMEAALHARHVPYSIDRFFPEMEKDKKEVQKYLDLLKAVHSLPDYHSSEVSMNWTWNNPAWPNLVPGDEAVRNECKGVAGKLAALFPAYAKKP